MSNTFTTADHIKAKEAAYAAIHNIKSAETSLVEYQSRGHVAIIGEVQAIEKLGALPDALSSEVISYQGQSVNDDISIEGALGQFKVSVAGQTIKADLVLDLSPQPILTMALKPPGYFAFSDVNANSNSNSNSNTNHIKNELADLVGTFEKPRYFDYNASVCAHSRSGQAGCTRCIDACPAEAITSLIDKIAVDPFRCQGGGICATVCPSGAIRYAYPKSEDLLTQVRLLIRTYLKEGATSPDLVFVTEAEQQRAQHILPTALVMVVEEVASVGSEIWLSALSWGAKSVRLFDLDGMPESARVALELNIDMVQAILPAMSYPATAVSLLMDAAELITTKSMPLDRDTSPHAAVSDKRQSFYMALDHLVASAEAMTKTVEAVVTLPTGSMFGEILVDKESCTLCMACVSACPANTLQDGSEKPQLGFVEANCLQCGVCCSTCPEDAISLSPRLLLDAEARRKPQRLHEEEPFCCTTCGKPFATKSGISTILDKLSGHYMFSDERAMSRLKMCSDCRVIDMAEDPNTDL